MISFDVAGVGSNNVFYSGVYGPGGGSGNGTTIAAAGASNFGNGHGPSYQGGTVTLHGVVAGLAIGTLYFFDVSAIANSGTQTQQIANVAGTVIEL